MPVNKMAMQNNWQHHVLEPYRGVGLCGTNWPTEIVVIATLYEFDKYDRFLTTSCDSYIVTLSDYFTHFAIKRPQSMAFNKNALSNNKTRQHAQG
jgi:hypothetical protein